MKDSSKLTIVAFGDSISEGTYGGANAKETFPALLEKMLLQHHIDARVINKGIPGETAPEALFRLQRDVVDLNPDMVLIMYGANDSWVPPDFNFSAVSVKDFSTAIGKMVNRLLGLSIDPILMTTTPICNPDFSGDAETDYLEINKQSLEEHLHEVRKLANEKQILLIDHYKIWHQMDEQNGIIRNLLPDGVHPGAEGNNLLATTIFQALINNIKKP